MTSEQDSPLPQPIQARWGEALEDGFLVVPTVLLRNQWQLELSASELAVLLNLLVSWRREDDPPFIQPMTVAKRMGVSQRSVQRHIEALKEKGFVTRVPRGDAPEGQQLGYEFSGLIARLRELGRVSKKLKALRPSSQGA